MDPSVHRWLHAESVWIGCSMHAINSTGTKPAAVTDFSSTYLKKKKKNVHQ